MADEKLGLKDVYVELFTPNRFPPEELRTCWVLSTGRCGTQTLDGLLSLSKGVASFHEPMPRLHDYNERGLYKTHTRLIKTLVHASRIDIVSAIHQLGLLYAECQHRWTFFARQVKEVFPRTRFIWLQRDMDGFVRSALQWHWFEDPTRIRPIWEKDEGKALAWYWCKTNEWIRDFVETLSEEDWMFLDFETIRRHEVWELAKIFGVLEVDTPSAGLMEVVLSQERNRGKRRDIKKGWGDFDERAKRIRAA